MDTATRTDSTSPFKNISLARGISPKEHFGHLGSIRDHAEKIQRNAQETANVPKEMRDEVTDIAERIRRNYSTIEHATLPQVVPAETYEAKGDLVKAAEWWNNAEKKIYGNPMLARKAEELSSLFGRLLAIGAALRDTEEMRAAAKPQDGNEENYPGEDTVAAEA